MLTKILPPNGTVKDGLTISPSQVGGIDWFEVVVGKLGIAHEKQDVEAEEDLFVSMKSG